MNTLKTNFALWNYSIASIMSYDLLGELRNDSALAIFMSTLLTFLLSKTRQVDCMHSVGHQSVAKQP